MTRKFSQLTNQELIDFLAAGGVLIDIRREEEWRKTGVVEGSLLLTFFAADGSSQPKLWLNELNRLVPTDKPIALICRTGYRTSLICDFLLEGEGREKFYNHTSGIFGWMAERLPLVSPE